MSKVNGYTIMSYCSSVFIEDIYFNCLFTSRCNENRLKKKNELTFRGTRYCLLKLESFKVKRVYLLIQEEFHYNAYFCLCSFCNNNVSTFKAPELKIDVGHGIK